MSEILVSDAIGSPPGCGCGMIWPSLRHAVHLARSASASVLLLQTLCLLRILSYGIIATNGYYFMQKVIVQRFFSENNSATQLPSFH